MNHSNAYESSVESQVASGAPKSPLSKTGMVVLLAGLAILSYGTLGFWVMPLLPPNNGSEGRLPSLYVMGFGALIAIAGLVIRSVATEKTSHPPENQAKQIPPAYGIIGLLGILGLVFFVITQL